MDFQEIYQALPAFLPKIAAALGIFLVGFLVIHWGLRPLGSKLLARTKWKPAVIAVVLSMAMVVAWVLVIGS